MDEVFTKIQKLRRILEEEFKGKRLSYDNLDTTVLSRIRKAYTEASLMLCSTTEAFNATLVKIPCSQEYHNLYLVKQKETVTESFTWCDIENGEQMGPIRITVSAIDELKTNNNVFDLVQWQFLLSYLMIPADLPTNNEYEPYRQTTI